MDTPTRKRARVDDVDSDSSGILASVPKQDEEFWHADGNIILVAQNVSFRVYRGVLAEHSPIFADMLSLPQPPNTSEDDCPIVQLDDSAQDLKHILCALLPRKTAMLLPGDPDSESESNLPSIDQLSAYARLGHKYQIDSLVKQTVQYLKRHFPSDLDDWLAADHYTPVPLETVHAIGVVNIARFLGCDVLLPVAILVCATREPEEIFKGYRRGDGTWEKLCQEDVLLCLRGKTKLMEEAVQLALHTFVPFSRPASTATPCSSTQRCEHNTLKALQFYDKKPRLFASEDPFLSWEEFTETSGRTIDKLCKTCQEELSSRYHTRQKNMWAKLPETLGLRLEKWPE